MSYPRVLSLFLVSAISVAASFGCKAPLRNGTGAGGSGIGNGGSVGAGGFGNFIGTGGSTGAGGGEVIITGSGGSGDGGSSSADGGGGTAGATGTGGSLVKMACGSSATDPLPYTAGYTANPTDRANAMSTANLMSNTDRAQQMSGIQQNGTANYNVFNQETNSALGIRGWYFRDGPRGVNLNANGDGKNDFSTAFPVAIARGAAFDMDLENKVGQAIGDEMLASGNTMMLAPTVNILRHPAWGRSQETYGEDSFLLGRLGSAFVMGLQNYVAACVKHYAANNIEDGRGTANAVIDAQTLREKYGRH